MYVYTRKTCKYVQRGEEGADSKVLTTQHEYVREQELLSQKLLQISSGGTSNILLLYYYYYYIIYNIYNII